MYWIIPLLFSMVLVLWEIVENGVWIDELFLLGCTVLVLMVVLDSGISDSQNA